MSKVGEKPIIVPTGVNVELKDGSVSVTGNNGQMTFALPPVIQITRQEDKLLVTRKAEDRRSKALHGLYRALVANAVAGFEKPWEKKLEVVGTGYNVKLQGEDLIFKVGYSHTVTFKKVEGITFKVEGNNAVSILGFDKHLVGKVAYDIKKIKKPDAYKGKGIRYEGEKLKLKPGKKAKTGGGD